MDQEDHSFSQILDLLALDVDDAIVLWWKAKDASDEPIAKLGRLKDEKESVSDKPAWKKNTLNQANQFIDHFEARAYPR